MKDANLIISGLEEKVRNLINEYNSLKIKHKELTQKEVELNKTIEHYKTIIKELEEKNRMLTITRSIESYNDSGEVKLKITELVREIDKCIGLLNR